MKPARLSETLVIEHATRTVEPSGAPVETWVEIARVRAERTEQEAVEQAQDRGAIGVETASFRSRWCDVALGDRIVWRDRAYSIVSLAEIGRREGLEIKLTRSGQ